MANQAAGTIWALPNYTGELFTADMINTPFLSMIGGLTGGLMTDNFEFPVDSLYEHEALNQENITEDESIAGVAAYQFQRSQEKNVTQIFMEAVTLSYEKLANGGRLSGINTAGAENNVVSEKEWQIAKHLESIARKVEWHFLNGTYNIATKADEANQTRGMINLCSTGNTEAASEAALNKTLLKTLWREMFTNGAIFKNLVAVCGAYQHEAITDLYGYAPESRNVGGLNIKQLETDYGLIAILPPHRLMATDTILFAELSVIAPVFQPVPGKGNLFYEDLAKTGAAETGQIFGKIGLDHGPQFMHGTLTGLKDSDE